MSEEKKKCVSQYQPSCGYSLLKAPLNTFDYALYLTDRKVTVKIQCHRCVLLAHSEIFRDLICNENFFDMEVCVKPGYLTAAVEVIQYMYLKDPLLITSKSKVLDMCGMFQMPLDHFLIASNKIMPVNTYPTVNVTIMPELDLENIPEKCILTADFWDKITVDEGKVSRVGTSSDVYTHKKELQTKNTKGRKLVSRVGLCKKERKTKTDKNPKRKLVLTAKKARKRTRSNKVY
jgi:hypothetical protein